MSHLSHDDTPAWVHAKIIYLLWPPNSKFLRYFICFHFGTLGQIQEIESLFKGQRPACSTLGLAWALAWAAKAGRAALMQQMFLVMAGGALGAAARFQLGLASARAFGLGWPWGTFIANIAGGLLMGLLAGWLAGRALGGEGLRLFLAVGVLGGFTTFSAFSLEAWTMLERGALGAAVGYIALSVTGSLGALGLGLLIMRSAG
jgi:fluoride exporter